MGLSDNEKRGENRRGARRAAVALALIVTLIIAPGYSLAQPGNAYAAPKFRATAAKSSLETIYVKKGTSVTVKGSFLGKGDKVKSYKSSKPSVATISKKGKLKAKKVGKTTITLTTKKGKKDKIKVVVVKKSAPIKSITITKTKKIKVSQVVRLKISTKPAKTTTTLRWSSSDKKIATVDQAGYITGKKAGRVTINVRTPSGKKAYCKLTVIDRIPSTAISLSPIEDTIYAGKKTAIEATLVSAVPGMKSNDRIEWKSSDVKVATVDSAGVVTGVAYGVATITATSESGHTAKSKITVHTVETKDDNAIITPGMKYKTTFVFYGSGTSKDVTYSSSDKSVATVDADGVVYANLRNKKTGKAKRGTVTITAKTKAGDKAKLKIVVRDEPTIVDLSKWQGDIDWAAASGSIDLAILRVIHGTTTKTEEKYQSYADSCAEYGVPFGVYAYVTYTSKKEAESQASTFYKQAVSDGRAPLFFVIDAEETYIKRSHTEAYIAKLRSLAKADGRERLKIGVYIGHHLYEKLDLNLKTDKKNAKTPDFVWIPRYNANIGARTTSMKKPDFACDMWQYASTGGIPGIAGNVDMDTLTDTTGEPLTEKSDFSFEWLTAGSEAG